MTVRWKMASRFVIALFLCLPYVESQRLNFGQCPQVKPMEDLDMNKISGEWVEVERSFYILESATACTRVNFTVENNETFKAEVSYRTPWRGVSSKSMYTADIKANPGEVDFMLETNLPSFMARLTPGSGKYIILDTDYDQYALIYSCTGMRIFHTDFIWILGRSSEITADKRAKVYALLNKLNIDTDRLIITHRKDC